MSIEVVLGIAIDQLLRAIEREREAGLRFESILTNLKSTLDSALPKISQISELRNSNGLSNDELHKLLKQLNQATETLDKFSRVACWNQCDKRKYMKELSRLDASLRDFFSINLQIEQYEDTSRIQVQLKELDRKLDRLITRKRNASRRMFNGISRHKLSVAAGELTNMVMSLPARIALYLRSFMMYSRWGYLRIANGFWVNSSEEK